MAAKPSGNKSVLVIGLGRFGGSVAATLDQMGQDVLAVDKNPELVARWSAHLPTIQADMTDVLAIEQIDASQFDTAVVAIGDSIEASVIITGNLLDAGVSDLWAKSVSQEHARILQRIGARHIINAETDAGKRVGHLVAGNYLDYIEIDGPYTVVKVHTPLYAVGRSIEDVQVHDQVRRDRGGPQGPRQGVPVRLQGTGHASQRRTHPHGQAGSDRPLHPRLTP